MKKIIFLVLICRLLSGTFAAADVKIPHKFRAGQVAKASEINANFVALQKAVEQLQQENRELKKQIAALQKQVGQPVNTPKREEHASAAQALRSEPRTVSHDTHNHEFGLDNDQRPLKYIDNDFEDRGEVVLDRATGLMWQRTGYSDAMSYQNAQAYVKRLNFQSYAGYRDWRLPTIPELMSLLIPGKTSDGLHINVIFDKRQEWCWSSDKRASSSSGSAWIVLFNNGKVNWNYFSSDNYVRAVRSN